MRELLRLDGGRLEVEWVGAAPGSAPTLVFLHDGLGCIDTWRDFPAVLAGALGCPGLVYSRAGYGGSDPVPGPRAPRFMHDEASIALPRLLAALGIDDAVLVGHSDGASIALLSSAGAAGAAGSAGRSPRSPAGSVRALVLEAPHVFVEPLSLESIARLRDGYEGSRLAGRMRRYHGAKADQCFHGWADVWLQPEFRGWNIEEVLPRITCPTLVIQGENDEFGTLAQVRAIAARSAGPVETSILPRCGHSPHLQQREAALEVMTRFLRRIIHAPRQPGRRSARRARGGR